MPHIVSTLAAGNNYNVYEPKPANNKASGVNVVKRTIAINGGANVAKRGGETGVLVPRGVVTSVSETDLELLEANPHFKEHVKRGFLKVMNEKVSGNKAAKDLNSDDESKALTIEDTKEGGRIAGAKPLTTKKIV